MGEFREEENKRKKGIRIFLGLIFLIPGMVFMIVPFIPLGYLFIFMGLFFLSPIIPWFMKLLEKVEKKDRKGRVKKARVKSEKVENKIDRKLEKLKRKRV